ncbi:MAG: alanine/glycine:cation symporter family protein [Bacteroidia bacterium]|nr:alanine/glycine:cation symporter family protein [Bacteroidia bacterium]
MRSLLFSLALLACLLPAAAQPDAAPAAPDSIAAPQPLLLPVQVDWVGADRKIDRRFAQFGNPISAAIFYAPKLREAVVYKDPAQAKPDRSFVQEPPFRVSYTASGAAALGVPFAVSQDAAGGWVVQYAEEITLEAGKPVQVGDASLSLVSVTAQGAGPKATAEARITVEGPLNQKLLPRTAPVETAEGLAALNAVHVRVTQQVRPGPDGVFEYGGVRYTLSANPASAYSFAGGKAYGFSVNEIRFMPLVVLFLILGATFFTLYFKFVNIRQFLLSLNVVRGKYTEKGETGEVSHFQALATALSGTVGLGNIAGVAIAISVGGPGATFWMIVAGLLGMSSKFVECTLGVAYRRVDANGIVSGGPMYYLSRGFSDRGWHGLGKFMAGFFAVMCIGGSFGGGNMFQANQSFKQIAGLEFVQNTWLADNGWFFGLVMAGMVAVVIIGGIQSIAKVTDKMVPFMCGIYVLAGLVIIGMNAGEIPRMLGEIFTQAFAPTAVAGGFIGVLIQGFRRAAFSNEAGVGSASIAHSAVRTNYPASEGIVALLEPFIDTVIVCTTTALVIIITNNHLDPSAGDGVALTSKAFSSQIPFFKYILTLAVFLFAFSTMISWSYYGLKAWTYLFGHNRIADFSYKLIFCAFIVVGSAANLGAVTDFSDAMIFAMSIPNIIGLVILAPVVRRELDRYLHKVREMDAARKAG